jgi:hypothetical protein
MKQATKPAAPLLAFEPLTFFLDGIRHPTTFELWLLPDDQALFRHWLPSSETSLYT